MDFKKIYDQLISTRKNRVLESDKYYENHHVIPRSMGGDDSTENLVKLTPREHFLAHVLLWEIHKNREMGLALQYMSDNGRYKMSSRLYAISREAARFSASLPRGPHSHTWNQNLRAGMIESHANGKMKEARLKGKLPNPPLGTSESAKHAWETKKQRGFKGVGTKGTIWVYNLELKVCKKLAKHENHAAYFANGWKQGRKKFA